MRYSSHILFFCAAIFLLVNVQCKKDNIVFPNPGYAIGIIDAYAPQYKTASNIQFEFSIASQKYYVTYHSGDNGWYVPGSGNYKIGDKYMVQYDQSNPNTARMLFDYPVKDSTDYIKYVNQFKTNPP
ncbi:MAG: hypothetical protein ACHQK8_03555 [Bacteroidia bacterium]